MVGGKGRVGYCALSLFLATTAGGATASAQAPRYDAAQLACVSYEVRVQTAVVTELQGRRREESLRRTGRLAVRGSAVDSALALEGWWDSLRLWRRAEGRTLEPDAEGVLGGRYRGTLTQEGKFLRTTTPWIPDDVAEVTDIGAALDDLFAPLPPTLLKRGEHATGLGGDQFTRLADSAGHQRYRIVSSSEVDSPADSSRSFAVHESESSDGILAWGRSGLARWDRTVIAETRVTETASRAFRSRIEQRIELQRIGECAEGDR